MDSRLKISGMTWEGVDASLNFRHDGGREVATPEWFYYPLSVTPEWFYQESKLFKGKNIWMPA